MDRKGKHYIHTNKAWYQSANRRDCADEVMFYTDEPWGEMAMRWYTGLGKGLTPRIEIYVQSANAFATLPDVLAKIAEYGNDRNEELTPDAFCTLLDSCGFANRTPLKYEDSYPNEGQTE